MSVHHFNHVCWPSFENIHAKLDGRDFKNFDVFVTEKIDGSNFGIEVWKDDVVSINSRNVNLWNISSTGPMPESFMKNNLLFITRHRKAFIELWKILTCADESKSIIVFGELFKNNFYPFGYGVRDLNGVENFRYCLMSPDLWEVFCDVGLTPPAIIFSGKLTSFIESYHDKMLNPREGFEGVFITDKNSTLCPAHNVCGFKYKTGPYEEQGYWKVKEDLISEEFRGITDLLKQVFDTKKGKIRKPKGDGRIKKKGVCYDREISLAFNSVNSKEGLTGLMVKEMTPEDRGEIIAKMIEAVRNEILENNTVTDMEDFLRQTKKNVPTLLFSC